jgi:hypothetical protein
MKKIIFALVMIVGMLSFTNTQAQTATLLPLAAGDTISTSGTKDTVSKVINITAGYSALGIQVVTTKVSGTVAGKAYLMASIDGTNYTTTDSSAAFTDVTTNTAFFTKVTTPYVKYKVEVREAGSATSTQANIVRVYYVARRHD